MKDEKFEQDKQIEKLVAKVQSDHGTAEVEHYRAAVILLQRVRLTRAGAELKVESVLDAARELAQLKTTASTVNRSVQAEPSQEDVLATNCGIQGTLTPLKTLFSRESASKLATPKVAAGLRSACDVLNESLQAAREQLTLVPQDDRERVSAEVAKKIRLIKQAIDEFSAIIEPFFNATDSVRLKNICRKKC